ncbi:hypothetical protein CK203_095403 [Vitis vinifera]|uniref:Uncharacterized protein n=1 Tax=Vitis vinifera TaxID=29760 RepID=A0A438BTY4_VITVI|nr:hypothetical protein CK203_095403 [Vitis vinifera]
MMQMTPGRELKARGAMNDSGSRWKMTLGVVVVDVFRTTPEYLPRQICKDFERDHGVHLTYNQAWHLKEKAKERLYGSSRASYMFLPWLCHRLREINPGTIAEYTSHEGHFKQFGPYKGALLSAIAYDVDDEMLPLALGVVTFTSSEHLFGTIRVCKEKLLNLPIGEEFCRAFIYYACASMTILHCVIKFQIPSVQVPIIVPPALAWTDELIKQQLAAEIRERPRDLQPQRLLWSQRLMWTMRQMLSLKIVIMSNRPISRGIQQQLGIMRDLMQKLGARRHSRVNTEATGYSGYAPTDNPTADDHVFPDCEEQPEGDVMRLSDFIITPTNRNVWRRRVRRMAPSLLFPFISQPQTRQYAIRMDLKEAIALVFGGDLDASEKLVAMHDTSLTRVNLGYFEGDGWIGNNVHMTSYPSLCIILSLKIKVLF